MNIQKSYAISDAQISFMSLVDRPANKRAFLITKQENDRVIFTSSGRILKVDQDKHYVTGVAYEPMKRDAHDNYMTEEEIYKAAYWFAKNGDKVDIQHSFNALEGAAVVENWVTKSDETIGDEVVSKGTWLVTVEISDPNVWEKIQKGEIEGFSIGGIGKYSEEDVDLEKGLNEVETTNTKEKKSFLKSLAGFLGFADVDVVEKDNSQPDESLAKAGRKMSAKNAERLRSACSSLVELLNDLEADGIEEKEEGAVNMTKDEVQKMIDDAVTKAMAPVIETTQPTTEPLVEDTVQKMISEAIAKELGAQDVTKEQPITIEQVQQMIDKAMEPILKSRGQAMNLSDDMETVEKKAAPHYLAGIL